ncbi:sulfite exporter TauE/SafE family protein [Filomicrobium sp.]|uniref:sulfite exporter TauE/SafE family protein n=1 Tax=Filomicrobium sp. TaxID=2024831 RepID=UPI00258CB128|nr:sulfite exporter TauE/SafE family protein [Filomicrobium sp.]MCV0369654.1 sulfite exporter TauE/SafE family protein [Filomicrobium sp.]
MTSVPSTKTPQSVEAHVEFATRVYLGALVALFITLLLTNIGDIARFFEFIWIFGPIGVFGAIIASSTGTGGGVVFVPAFNTLSGASEMGAIPMELAIDPIKTIGISFLIQCFGMSVGASVWIRRFYGGGQTGPREKIDGHSFLFIIFTLLATTLPALLVTQFALFSNVDGRGLLVAFKWFSLTLGVVLLIFTWAFKRVKPYRFHPERLDYYWLLGLGAIGGVITAFFSVGVGELVAVYLILRKFPTPSAIAIAVIISVVTVIFGVGYHIANNNIIWPVALTAIPGAMIGGFVARYFAIWLGPLWLKTFASLWIILSSAFLIVGPYLGLISK